MRTRIISLVMVLALVFTLLPVYAIADAVSVTGNDDTTDSQSIDIQDIVGKIQALIKGGDPNGELENLLKGLNIDTIVQILEKLGLDSNTAKQLLEKLKDMDMKTLYETLKKLLENGSFNSKDIIDILKYLFGDSNGNIDTDKIIEILKGLIGGDGDIGGILGQLDAYTLLKAIAGLIGSKLDVTGPKDVNTPRDADSTKVRIP